MYGQISAFETAVMKTRDKPFFEGSVPRAFQSFAIPSYSAQDVRELGTQKTIRRSAAALSATHPKSPKHLKLNAIPTLWGVTMAALKPEEAAQPRPPWQSLVTGPARRISRLSRLPP